MGFGNKLAELTIKAVENAPKKKTPPFGNNTGAFGNAGSKLAKKTTDAFDKANAFNKK